VWLEFLQFLSSVYHGSPLERAPGSILVGGWLDVGLSVVVIKRIEPQESGLCHYLCIFTV
jgi:hypothetical protein